MLTILRWCLLTAEAKQRDAEDSDKDNKNWSETASVNRTFQILPSAASPLTQALAPVMATAQLPCATAAKKEHLCTGIRAASMKPPQLAMESSAAAPFRGAATGASTAGHLPAVSEPQEPNNVPPPSPGSADHPSNALFEQAQGRHCLEPSTAFFLLKILLPASNAQSIASLLQFSVVPFLSSLLCHFQNN